MKRLIVSFILVVTMLLVPLSGGVALLLVTAGAVQAATSANVTVTAVPGYIIITNDLDTWEINGISGNGVIATGTTYYANTVAIASDTTAPVTTVGDNDCRFTITNGSSVNTTITVNFDDFVGGDTMTNSNFGTSGTTTFGAHSYYSGGAWSGTKVIAKTTGTGSDALISDLNPTITNLKWGLEVLTRTDAWTSGTSISANVTISATQYTP